jgi:hypothetical protein
MILLRGWCVVSACAVLWLKLLLLLLLGTQHLIGEGCDTD